MALNLTDNWQMAKILTDNWHLYPPHPDPHSRFLEVLKFSAFTRYFQFYLAYETCRLRILTSMMYAADNKIEMKIGILWKNFLNLLSYFSCLSRVVLIIRFVNERASVETFM